MSSRELIESGCHETARQTVDNEQSKHTDEKSAFTNNKKKSI